MTKRFISFVLILLASSCDPDNKDIFNAEGITVKGTFNKVSESIALGDTIKLTIALPDTIKSNGRGVFVQSLQTSDFAMYISKVDTINRRSMLLSPPIYWTTEGNISSTNSFFFSLSKSAKPFRLVINVKPTEKGLYAFQVISQPGKLKVNNSFEPRLVVNFDVPDKHIYLAEPFYGADWANASRNSEASTYVFRVN